jgi:hypothetical protein
MTDLLYNGQQIVTAGDHFLAGAKLSSSSSACVSGQPVTFSLDVDPTTGDPPPYVLGSGTTDSSGQVTVSVGTTPSWLEGCYDITADFAGTSTCLPSTDSATFTVAAPGDSATGGGWYTLSGSGRINFGFTVRKDCKACNCCGGSCTTCSIYKGQALLINNGKWRLKGTLNTYSQKSNQGAAGGSGNLYWWDATSNGGLGSWVLSEANVAFTMSFSDSGEGGKKSSDKFGIIINHTLVSGEPGGLPNSSPIQLKGGNISVQ